MIQKPRRIQEVYRSGWTVFWRYEISAGFPMSVDELVKVLKDYESDLIDDNISPKDIKIELDVDLEDGYEGYEGHPKIVLRGNRPATPEEIKQVKSEQEKNKRENLASEIRKAEQRLAALKATKL